MLRPSRLSASITVLLTLVAALLAAVGVAGASTAAAGDLVTLPDTAATWVAAATSLGAAKASGTSTFQVYLAPRGGLEALQTAVANVSDPDSKSYGHYLTAAGYHSRFDPTVATASQVRGYLTRSGLRVTSTAAHRRYLTVTGTNASVAKALGTTIGTYRHHGQTVQANQSAVRLPSSIAAGVLTVTGLDTTPHRISRASTTPVPPSTGFVPGRPCSKYYGQLAAKYQADYQTPLPKYEGKTLPYAVCGYVGSQLRPAYQGANRRGLTGEGITIGVLDAYASPTIWKDTAKYASLHGDGAYGENQYRQTTPEKYSRLKECGASGWFGEQTLDIEAEHAMAPGADIRYYAAKSCYDDAFLTALDQIVDANKVSLVSNSWDDSELNANASTVAAYEQAFLQGAMEGISFTFSSGDDGDELASTGTKQVDYPASDPYVTAVGGTADAIGADGSMLFQTGWGTQSHSLTGKSWGEGSFLYGAGGGVSTLFAQPSYQAGVVPASSSSGRAVPDVAMDADVTTGFLVGQTQTFSTGIRYDEYRIGGTSLASPLYAGETALLMQRNDGQRLGLLNPLLYKAVLKKGGLSDVKGAPDQAGNVRVNYVNSEDASDGLSYSVRTFNEDSSLATAPGWDDVTGLGAPDADYIVMKMPSSS